VNHLSTPAPSGSGPWRILLLDRDPQDPNWLFATISLPSDVRPAVLDSDGRYQDWGDTVRWVNAKFPGAVALQPITGPLAWHIDESRRPR
jgi:hypothetical protein